MLTRKNTKGPVQGDPAVNEELKENPDVPKPKTIELNRLSSRLPESKRK